MKKFLLTTLLLFLSAVALGEETVIYKIGALQLIQEYDVKSPNYESGTVSRSIDVKLIKETNNIEYKLGNAFGVIIENLSPGTKINATWLYPKRDTIGQYRYPEEISSNRYFIYWVLDKGELPGNYLLEVTLNGSKPKNISFNVQQ